MWKNARFFSISHAYALDAINSPYICLLSLASLKSMDLTWKIILSSDRHTLPVFHSSVIHYSSQHQSPLQVLNDFICAVMTEKPKNIFKFARYWFSMSLPPLDVVASTDAKNASSLQVSFHPHY